MCVNRSLNYTNVYCNLDKIYLIDHKIYPLLSPEFEANRDFTGHKGGSCSAHEWEGVDWVAGSCEDINEPSGATKGREFLD
jgi:hypothetical protein